MGDKDKLLEMIQEEIECHQQNLKTVMELGEKTKERIARIEDSLEVAAEEDKKEI